MNITPNDILTFWFSDKVEPLWFNSTPEFDSELKEQFEELYVAALAGNLSDWQNSAEGSVALVVILDQFPLNMYRGSPESFGGEAKAREIAKDAINKGFDSQINDVQKAFLYMPLMHSENIDDQDLSVSLFEAAGLKENLRFAKHHRDIVKRFGRFPHRNKILGRTSSQAELEYLDSKEAFHG